MLTSIETEQAINKALSEIRPYLMEDGGDVELVRFEEETRIVEIRLLGNCKSCPMSGMTLRGGIERYILSNVPDIKRIEAIP